MFRNQRLAAQLYFQDDICVDLNITIGREAA